MTAIVGDLPAALKRRTRAAHDAVETAFDLPLRVSSVARYRDLLVRLYAFHRAWEAAVPEYSTGRLSLLRQDLQALGLTEAQLDLAPGFAALPDLGTPAARAGAAYVMHGAALGGLVIAAAAHRSLGLDETTGCAFFRSDGRQTAERWRAFQAKLGAKGQVLDEDAVVEGAEAMFAAMERCLTD